MGNEIAVISKAYLDRNTVTSKTDLDSVSAVGKYPDATLIKALDEGNAKIVWVEDEVLSEPFDNKNRIYDYIRYQKKQGEETLFNVDFDSEDVIMATKCNDGSVYFFSNNIPEYESLVDPERAPKKKPYVMPYPVIHRALPYNAVVGMKYLFMGCTMLVADGDFYVKITSGSRIPFSTVFSGITTSHFKETNGAHHSENSVTLVYGDSETKIFHVEPTGTTQICRCELLFIHKCLGFKILDGFTSEYNGGKCFDLSKLELIYPKDFTGPTSSPFVKLVNNQGHLKLSYDGARESLPTQILTSNIKEKVYLYDKRKWVLKIRKKRRNLPRKFYVPAYPVLNPEYEKNVLKVRIVEDFLVCELSNIDEEFIAQITVMNPKTRQSATIEINHQNFYTTYLSNTYTVTRRNQSGDTFYGWSVVGVVFERGGEYYRYQAGPKYIRTAYRNIIIKPRRKGKYSQKKSGTRHFNQRNGVLVRLYPVHREIVSEKFFEVYFKKLKI